MSTLFIIPARGGSKGIPGKNYKMLGNKPLIQYSLDVARSITSDENICVSTDDTNIIKVLEEAGYTVPFMRPLELASDTAGTYEVIMHALAFYERLGKTFDRLALLQPTSPFRTENQVKEALELYTKDCDMVISVRETKANPYYLLMEEDENGWLKKSKQAHFVRRQDIPKVWELNGAIYIMNINSLKQGPITSFKKIRKYVMDDLTSIDLDIPFDWLIAETLLEKGWIKK